MRWRTVQAPESHPGVAAAARLRRLASRLQDGDDDGRWLAAGLLHYLEAAPSGIDLDRALGLATAPGGSPWWRVPTMAERDRLIRYLAADLGGRTNQRAAQLQQRLRRYASSAWPRDRASKAPTAANAMLYQIYLLDPDPPTGIRQLTEIIGE
jgi:hypothetical protein